MAVVATTAALIAGVNAYVNGVFSIIERMNESQQRAYASAAYAEGEMVVIRLTSTTAMVTDLSCSESSGCSYTLRVADAAGVPTTISDMREYELEAVK